MRSNRTPLIITPLILASASPRRQELLTQAGIPFEVDPSRIAEIIDPSQSVAKNAKRLAQAKAEEVSKRHPHRWILAADTLGAIEGKILGKPETVQGAHRMLQLLSGKTHQIITAFTLLNKALSNSITRAVVTQVTFKTLSEKTIEAYIQTGEPLDKAAAYAIQGKGAALIETIEGDRDNVIGLPIRKLKNILQRVAWKME